MDIDDDGTQKPVQVNDFGIEPDFDILDDEEKEVSSCVLAVIDVRMAEKRLVERSRRKSPE